MQDGRAREYGEKVKRGALGFQQTLMLTRIFTFADDITAAKQLKRLKHHPLFRLNYLSCLDLCSFLKLNSQKM